MHSDFLMLVEAINGLKQDSSILLNIVFPVFMALFSSLLGAGVAYFIFVYQEKNSINREKLDSINNIFLTVEDALSSLIAIKQNYHGQISNDPIQRFLKVPTIILTGTPADVDLAKLVFIVPNKLNDKVEVEKWESLTRIRAMIKNYNHILDLWLQRNELERPIKLHIMENRPGGAYATITPSEVIQITGAQVLLSAVDLNEIAIKLTDNIIIEMMDFLQHFPDIAKSKISEKMANKYGKVLKYSIESEKLRELVKPSPELRLEMVAGYFGIPLEDVKSRYETGYE